MKVILKIDAYLQFGQDNGPGVDSGLGLMILVEVARGCGKNDVGFGVARLGQIDAATQCCHQVAVHLGTGDTVEGVAGLRVQEEQRGLFTERRSDHGVDRDEVDAGGTRHPRLSI